MQCSGVRPSLGLEGAADVLAATVSTPAVYDLCYMLQCSGAACTVCVQCLVVPPLRRLPASLPAGGIKKWLHSSILHYSVVSTAINGSAVQCNAQQCSAVQCSAVQCSKLCSPGGNIAGIRPGPGGKRRSYT